jgi:Cu(I)/Ag(I) efflux system membrane fusion protein/cobalt-zinc-cadmium efflux system membrane fusion protein
MGMGAMTTTVKLNENGAGIFEGAGSLGSSGTWQVTITAEKNGQMIAEKQLTVTATGGM